MVVMFISFVGSIFFVIVIKKRLNIFFWYLLEKVSRKDCRIIFVERSKWIKERIFRYREGMLGSIRYNGEICLWFFLLMYIVFICN